MWGDPTSTSTFDGVDQLAIDEREGLRSDALAIVFHGICHGAWT